LTLWPSAADGQLKRSASLRSLNRISTKAAVLFLAGGLCRSDDSQIVGVVLAAATQERKLQEVLRKTEKLRGGVVNHGSARPKLLELARLK
jgi:hypothetical protein